MRKCFQGMRSGYADSARGYAVTRLHEQDDYVRTDYCIAGFRALIARLFPDLSTLHMERVQKRLSAGVLVSPTDLDGCLRECREAEDRLITVTVADLKSAVLTEQINIELEAMKDDLK
jgi:hypothetical protein